MFAGAYEVNTPASMIELENYISFTTTRSHIRQQLLADSWVACAPAVGDRSGDKARRIEKRY